MAKEKSLFIVDFPTRASKCLSIDHIPLDVYVMPCRNTIRAMAAMAAMAGNPLCVYIYIYIERDTLW